MTEQIVINGLSDASKAPTYAGEVRVGQSQAKLTSIPIKVLFCGLKHDTVGTAVVDTQIVRVTSKDEADTYFGAGGELNRMLCAAIDETQGMSGFEFYGIAPTAAGGAAAATLTITVTGSLTAATGTLDIWIGGDHAEVAVTNGQTVTQVADAIEAAVEAMDRCRVLIDNVAGVATLTVKSAGARGNQLICYVDFTNAAGLTLALGGAGSAVTSASPILGRTFGGGTGTETMTTTLATLFPAFHKFNAPAQNDATSLALWETQNDTKAGAMEGRKEHFVVGNNGNFAAAQSIAQTTLNTGRFSLKWLEISETPPSEIAAAVAAVRAAHEGTSPNKAYDDYKYKTIKPQRFTGDWTTSFADKDAALNVGVSPLQTKADGSVYEVRSITTRCLVNGVANYSCLDTSESYGPDHVNERIQLMYETEWKIAMPHVAPDPTASEPEVEDGIATPSNWSARVNREMLIMQKEKIVIQAALFPTQSTYNYAANRIMSVNPVVMLPHQHQIGVLTKQLNVADVDV